MENKIKLATWNICLGLANKKDLVSSIIMENEIDICVLQEIDIVKGFDIAESIWVDIVCEA